MAESGTLFVDVEQNQKDGGARIVRGRQESGACDTDQKVVGTPSDLLQDVTDRQRDAEEALRESTARRRAIFEAALDCIIIVDHEGKIVEFNQSAEKAFGYRQDEAVGQDMDTLLLLSAGHTRQHVTRKTSKSIDTLRAREQGGCRENWSGTHDAPPERRRVCRRK